jgi:hypothetical protein
LHLPQNHIHVHITSNGSTIVVRQRCLDFITQFAAIAAPYWG